MAEIEQVIGYGLRTADHTKLPEITEDKGLIEFVDQCVEICSNGIRDVLSRALDEANIKFANSLHSELLREISQGISKKFETNQKECDSVKLQYHIAMQALKAGQVTLQMELDAFNADKKMLQAKEELYKKKKMELEDERRRFEDEVQRLEDDMEMFEEVKEKLEDDHDM